nr:LytTR family DNA-binding domain-containing protein [Sphingomonas sp. ID1715]
MIIAEGPERMAAGEIGGLWRVPLRGTALLAAASILLGAGAAYCMGYALLSGGTNAWARALGWSAGAVLPWFLMFEAVKRVEARRGAPLGWRSLAVLLAATALVSLGIEEAVDRLIWGSATAPLPLQMLRRVPALLLLGVLLLLRRGEQRPDMTAARTASDAEAVGLRYARAADNYVELHYSGHMRMERETLARLEARLSGRGFVRVHRSILVHPRWVCRIEPGRAPTLLLDDGTRLPTGSRYRETLRHFVP